MIYFYRSTSLSLDHSRFRKKIDGLNWAIESEDIFKATENYILTGYLH